jgi:hypothetical protein
MQLFAACAYEPRLELASGLNWTFFDAASLFETRSLFLDATFREYVPAN